MTTNTKRCRICRAKFTPKAGAQKYCSSKCRDKAKRIQNHESAKRRYDRRKLAQPKPRWDLSTVGFETFPLPDNGMGSFCHRQPDPYWGF